MDSSTRVLLIDPNDARREMLARRLRAQGYGIDDTADAAIGADLALRSPPSAVIADLWMPSISGVQLCRLLGSEPATADVPVILCGDQDEPRNRFWSERAGAAAYVIKGRTAELVGALEHVIAARPKADDSFFVQLSGGSMDVRDRLARHLDEALFDSVLAAELRALASAGSFDRLFDRLAQFLSRVMRYRWIAMTLVRPAKFAMHRHPNVSELAEREARAALGVAPETATAPIEDEDAAGDLEGPSSIAVDILFDKNVIARFACAPIATQEDEALLHARIISRELGGVLRVATLVEESERLAMTDGLTGLMNRRAFGAAISNEIARSTRHGYPLSLVMLDADHFKNINDQRGHAAGDRVLAALGELLTRVLRRGDVAARWGGEEFVIACTSTDKEHAQLAAERIRSAIEEMVILDSKNERIPVTASLGVAMWKPNQSFEALVDDADRAMYASKVGGRNRVTLAEDPVIHLTQKSCQNAGATFIRLEE
ncbi:MAG: diguanylate cyclase [Polyangiaceae bacterium]